MSENTREIALEALLAIEREEDFSHRILKAVLDKYDYLEERDKAFIKRVTEGTTERRIELDYYLDQVSSVPVRKMKPLIRCLMRLSVYQLLYMDNVPDAAVCNEACKIAQKRKFANLKGFVNGVLRNIARKKGELSLPDERKDAAEYLSVRYSMPRFIVEMWIKQYGRERAERLLDALLKIHPVSVRFRTDMSDKDREELIGRMEKAGAKLARDKTVPFLYTMEHSENIAQLPGFAEGKYTVQDASSVQAVLAAGIGRQDHVMDICAAPGGKSILAAELACEGQVLSRDVSEKKIDLIEENKARMGVENMIVEVYDATETDETRIGWADVLLADVPCSGLGVLGKKRDIKYRLTPEQFDEVEVLQRRIIEHSWQYVKEGGVLLYSTCTVRPEENEQMARRIADEFPFELEEERQFLPGEDETDGFYYARLRRKN